MLRSSTGKCGFAALGAKVAASCVTLSIRETTMRSLAPICFAIALASHATNAEGQRVGTVLRLSRSSNEHIVALPAVTSDSARSARPLVLVGALVGAVAGGVVYARSMPNDGDFGGIGVYVSVVGGIVIGTLVGYVASVVIERSHPHGE